MAYPKKLKERAIRLADEGLSAEKIADIFSKEVEKKEHDYTPEARTIRNWLSEVKKEQVSAHINLEITKEVRLEEHFYELGKMAIRLADTIEGILVHKDRVGKRYSITLVEERHYSCVKFCGNIIDGGSISEFETDESGAVIESTMIPFESTDVIWKPVDSFTATCLLEHLKNRFPDVVSFKDWRELSHDNVSPRIVDKLRLLAHFKNFSVCPTCPICKDLQL